MARNFILIAALLLIGGSIFYLQSTKIAPTSQADAPTDTTIKPLVENMTTKEKASRYGRVHEIVNPQGFINTTGLKLADLVGKKVILVDFWTYSCINCQRTLPYLNAWYEKYKDQGLEIVGVHTPEFKFEQELNNVTQAVKKYGIQYPVLLDNRYETWTAYGNRYWPRKYLIDIDGFIVYDHIGEGAYDETEKKIQELLAERAERLKTQFTAPAELVAPKNILETDAAKVQSPEIYFGSARNTYLGNGKSEWFGAQTLSLPTGIKTNILYLDGTWDFAGENAENKTLGRIVFRYQAKDVYFVASSKNPLSIRVLRDGQPLGNLAGEDVNQSDSRATIQAERLYKLIKGDDYGEHTLEIIIESPGLRAFTFTFG